MERHESDPPPAATSSARAETWVWTLDPAAFRRELAAALAARGLPTTVNG